MEQKREMPFRPQLRSKSVDRERIQNGKGFHARMRDYSRNKLDRRRKLEEELTRQQCTFRPDTTKSAKSIEQLRKLDRRRKREINGRTGGSSISRKSPRKSQPQRRSKVPNNQIRRRKDLLKQLELAEDQFEYRSEVRQRRSESHSESFEDEHQMEQRPKAKRRKQAKKYINQSGQFLRKQEMGPGEKGFRRADVLFDNLNNTELVDNTLLQKVSKMGRVAKVGAGVTGRKEFRPTSSRSRGICGKKCLSHD